jgi:hypothetical protein
MKSIERRFKNIREKKDGWSSYTVFAQAVTGQKFSRDTLHRGFNKLVEKDDYVASEKKGVLAHLYNLTNDVWSTGKGGKSSA